MEDEIRRARARARGRELHDAVRREAIALVDKIARDADMVDAHAEGMHDDLPREGCPECER